MIGKCGRKTKIKETGKDLISRRCKEPPNSVKKEINKNKTRNVKYIPPKPNIFCKLNHL